MAEDSEGPALGWLKLNPQAHLWISPVTLAEVLEGAEDQAAVGTYLSHYKWQGIHRMQAEKVAIRQRRAARRLGENDAWQAAIADCMQSVVLGHDRAFKSLGKQYEDFR